MESTKMFVDLFVPWTNVQQTLWKRWRAAMENGVAPTAPTIGTWNLPMEFWKAAIYGSLEAQLAWAEMWKTWVCANDANAPEVRMGACQTLHFVEDWTRAQMQVWEGWFAALENLAPETAAQATTQPPTHSGPRRHTTPTHVQSHNGVPA